MPPLSLDLADRVRRHRRANLELPSAAPPRPVPPQDLVDRMLKRRADVERAPADGEQDGARDVEGGRRRVAGAPGVDLEARHLRASREGGADLVTEAAHGARPRREASSPLTPTCVGPGRAKNAPVEDVTVAESGAEAPLDASILKTDLAAEDATATVDSDRAKAMFAAYPRANAVFWSKFERPTDPPPARTGVTKNGPALEPVTKVATAVKPAAAGGETLPSIKECPEEEPAPAASASQHHSVHTLWSTP